MKTPLTVSDILAAAKDLPTSITELIKALSPYADSKERNRLGKEIKELLRTEEAQAHVGLAAEKTVTPKISYYATVVYPNPEDAAYSRTRVENADPEAYAKFLARTSVQKPKAVASANQETLLRIEALLIRIADVL